ALEATEDRELVDLLGHLLQRLQLFQPQKRAVLIHESRGVQQRPGRCRLLAALDQVGLSHLLRLHDLVENRLHLTRQDDVLHTHRTHRETVLLNLGAHNARDLTIQSALVAKQLIEGTCTHGLPQRELQLLTTKFVSAVRAFTASSTCQRPVRFSRRLTLSRVRISWPATSIACTRRSTSSTFRARWYFQNACSPGSSTLESSPSTISKPIAVSGTSVALTASDTCVASGCFARTSNFARAFDSSYSWVMS